MNAHPAQFALEGRRMKIGAETNYGKTEIKCRCNHKFLVWLSVVSKIVCHRCNTHSKVRRI